MTDEMLMRSAQLTPEYRPLVDFHVQYSTVQSQKGWRYGYTDAARPMERNTTFHEMVWHPHRNGHLADGRWQATEVRANLCHIHLETGRLSPSACGSWRTFGDVPEELRHLDTCQVTCPSQPAPFCQLPGLFQHVWVARRAQTASL